MEFEKYGDELDVDIVDDDIDDMGDEEDDEYDEYDEDEDVEEAEEPEENEEAAEISEEPEEEHEAEAESTAEPADGGNAEAEKSDVEKDFALKLLNDMGYSGTYDEAKAAYEAEHGASGKPSDEGSNSPPDYDAMAKQMLDSINAEFGLELKSFAEIDDLSTFADLAVNDKVGAIKAFRATNHRLIEQAAKKAAITNLPKATRNVQSLPKSNGGNATVTGETISKRELREYMDAFPELSRDEAIKLIRRVKKK